MTGTKNSEQVLVPLDCRSSVYFIDESGSKGSGGRHFVVAGLKTNDPDALTRGMEVIRAKRNVRRELKFRELTKGSVPVFKDLVDLIVESGSHVGAFVIDKDTYDPFAGKELWNAHAWVTAALVKGMTTRKELVTLLIDGISTPVGVAYGSHLRDQINGAFKTMRVVSAVSLDSRTCDGLQLADLIASAIAHHRKSSLVGEENRGTPKAEVARYLARALDLSDFSDVHEEHVKIRTAAARAIPVGQIDRKSALNV